MSQNLRHPDSKLDQSIAPSIELQASRMAFSIARRFRALVIDRASEFARGGPAGKQVVTTEHVRLAMCAMLAPNLVEQIEGVSDGEEGRRRPQAA